MFRRPRYVPDRPFPPYTFIPGQAPHPISDPRGHSYGVHEPSPSPMEPERWGESEDYLWGVDLYNHGYPWEAHEAWEGLWSVAERRSIVHMHLQGLIQCAAAVVKALGDRPAGVASLSKSALGYLDRVIEQGGSPHLGVDLADFRKKFQRYAEAEPFRAKKWPIIRLRGR